MSAILKHASCFETVIKDLREFRDSLMNGRGKGCCFDGLMGYALHMHEHCNYLDSLFASTVALALLHSLPLTSTNRGKLPL